MRLTTLLTITLLSVQTLFAQLIWESRASLPNLGRHDGVSFVLNGKIYAGLGRIHDLSHVKDFWQYDPSTDIWTKMANYPGNGEFAPFYFEANNKGYVVGGYGDFGVTNETWEYDPASNTWTQKADFPGGVRYSGAAFVIGDTAYVGSGASGLGSKNFESSFYRYIPSTDTWSAIASYPGGNSINHSCFSIDGFGFVGNNTTTSITASNAFYKYDPSSDSWSTISSMPGSNRRLAIAVSIDGQALVGCGTVSGSPISTYVNDFYMYTASTDSWTHLASNSNFIGRYAPILCNIGDSAIYVGLGKTRHASLTDFWKLKVDSNSCGVFDTTHINLYNTLTDTIFYIDTTFITVYDSSSIAQNIGMLDTLNIKLYDHDSECISLDIQVYPNPTSELLNVFSIQNECLKNSEIELVDHWGRVIDSKLVTQSLTSFDLRGYAPAIYTLRITNSFGVVQGTAKILIE